MNDTSPRLKRTLDYSSFDVISPSSFLPKLTDEDYSTGFITRYFVSQRNTNNILETNLSSYNLISSILYVKGSLTWKITGPKYDEYEDGIRIQKGVWEYNNNQILKLEKQIPGVKNVLPNVFQFWKRHSN